MNWKKYYIILFSFLCVTSCFVAKTEITHPYVKFQFFDSQTKEPIKDVALYKLDTIVIAKSNENGTLILPKLKMDFVKHNYWLLPPHLMDRTYVIKKEGYRNFELLLYSFFNINSREDLKKRYKAEILLIKE